MIHTKVVRSRWLAGVLGVFLAVTCIGQAVAQTCVPPPAGMVGWWPGDRHADDLTGSNDGTLQNGATFARGMVGPAFSFDGLDDFVAAPHHASQNLQSALTIDAWVMIQGPCEWLNCIIVMKQQAATGPCCDHLRYGLFVDDNPFDVNSGKATLAFNTGGWDDNVISTTILQQDVWYHIAGTYDGSTAQIYVNGVLENVVPKTGLILPSTAGPLFIGRDRVEDESSSSEFFNGLLDEVTIYNRALTAEEIRAIYEAGSAGKCKPSPPVGGIITGLSPTRITCTNKTTGAKVTIQDDALSYDCEAAGLVVHAGDRIAITVQGTADE